MATRRKPPPQHQVTTTTQWIKCPKCARTVMDGLVDGEHTRLDPTPITLRAEAMALVCGIDTFELPVLGRDRPMLRRRWHIQGGLPEFGYIHARHRCGMHWNLDLYKDTRKIFHGTDICDF